MPGYNSAYSQGPTGACLSMIAMTAALTLASLAILAAPASLLAQSASVGDWEPTGLAEPAYRLHTPASGALYASAQPGLLRSDDGGASWRPVGLPPEAWNVTVDPVDQDILYAATQQGLHKSSDAGVTWKLILARTFAPPGSSLYQSMLREFKVSPANHQLLYLVTSSSPSSLDVSRSPDGGVTWEHAFTGYTASPSFAFTVDLLLVHGTDPARLLLAVGSFGPDGVSKAMRQSADQGRTWGPNTSPTRRAVTRLIGWRGAMPTRLYLLAAASELYRTDDDGQTWTQVLTIAAEDASDQSNRISALTYDPSHPDTVYLAVGGSVRASTDAGATWRPLGRQDLPGVASLALGIDGRNLYVATSSGVYHLQLDPT
jgi:photosystem II stability/assembly factor-like uncharacterized protein